MTSNSAKSSAPIKKFSFAGVDASVFARQIQPKSGKPFTKYSVSLQRSYTTANGKRAYTSTLDAEHLPSAITALQQADEFIAEQRRSGEPTA